MVGFSDGSRSLIGSDLDQADIDALYGIVGELNIIALKTRVADLIWSRDKSKADCARLAIDGYASMVEGLLAGNVTQRFENPRPTSVASQNFLTRGFAIARAIGWTRPENDRLKAVSLEVLREAFAEGGVTFVRFGRLVLDWGVLVGNELFDQLPQKVEEALATADFHGAEELQQLVISYARRVVGAEEEVEKGHFLKLASIHEQQADASDSSFLKTHCLQSAIDSLHGVKGVREERQRLHEKLKEAQLHLADEFTPIGHSIDISDEIDRLLEGYEELELLEALRRLALTELPKKPEVLIENAREEMEKFPLSSLFSMSILDEKGRTRARTAGGGTENDDAVRHKVLQHQDINMGLAAQAAIRPARQFITGKFRIDQSLLFAICRMSPFVPSGLEHLVSRGLQAFLYGDDQVAAACLVPTLEAGLRSLVVVAGRVDTTISTGGIEQTIGLGPLLSDHRDVLERVFGDWMIFAIENIFVHNLGPKVRHSICHGLAADGVFYSNTYVYACKLIFSLVMLPLIGDNWDVVKERLRREI